MPQFSWYIAYSLTAQDFPISMKLTRSRDEAIETACAMLNDGFNVRQVGPMMGPDDGVALDATELRRYQAGKRRR
jgi:hypothetical protein